MIKVSDYIKRSSIRLSLVWVLALSSVLVLAVAGHIIYMTWYDKSIDWVGLSVFLGATSAFIGVAITGKWASKKVESKHGEDRQV